MDPISYDSAFANLQSPAQSFTQGLQGGLALQQVQQEQAQQQAALARKQNFQADVAALGAAPTAAGIAQLSIKYPEHSEDFKRSLDMLTPVQRQAKIDAAGPIHAAALSGATDVAAKQLREHADALQNSGNEAEAKQTRAMADLIEQHPETATTTTGLLLAAAMGPEKYTDAFKDIGAEGRAAGLYGDLKRKGAADAGTAEADLAAKNYSILAQQAGALAKPGIKPAQAITMFKSLEARGIIPKGGAQGYIDGMPSGEKELPDYLKQIQASGVKADDQMKFTTPTADAALSANTQIQATGMNNRTQLAVQDRIDARNQSDTNVKHGALGLSNEQNEALFGENGAVTTGRLDPNRINSRTAALYADAFIKNPKVDMAKISGDIALGRNATFRQNAMTAEVLPEIMQNMVNAGKKLKFSDNRTVGKMQGWVKGEVNDPDMVEYMTQRNDALMTVARVMRGAGMTDMAHKAETEVSAPTMSPDALDAWMRGQMKSLQPRLDINRRVTRDSPASRSASATSSAPALPAGWSVKEH